MRLVMQSHPEFLFTLHSKVNTGITIFETGTIQLVVKTLVVISSSKYINMQNHLAHIFSHL